MMNIGKAAAASGVSAKMIRYYESIGLLPAARRTDSGYRFYTDEVVHVLRFIRRARDMGFGLDDIAELVGLWHNRKLSSASVKRIAQQHQRALSERIVALQAMHRSLETLLCLCPGDGRPDCPILDDLAHP